MVNHDYCIIGSLRPWTPYKEIERDKMMTKEIKGLIVLATLVSLLLTSGCFQQSVDYSIVVEYKPTGEIPKWCLLLNLNQLQSRNLRMLGSIKQVLPGQKSYRNIAIRYNSSRPLAIVVQEACEIL